MISTRTVRVYTCTVSTLHTLTHYIRSVRRRKTMKMLMSRWDKWSVLITRKSFACKNGFMWKHHCIFSNTSSRFAKFRKLAWGGGQKGFVVGALPPPLPPLWLRPWVYCMYGIRSSVLRNTVIKNLFRFAWIQ